MTARPGLVIASVVTLTVAFLGAAVAQPRPQSANPQPQARQATPEAVRTARPVVQRSYNAGGRRDPFVSLLRSGSDPSGLGNSPRPVGIAGLLVSEVALRGVMQSPAGFVGLLQGSDGKTHVVRAGDRLFDGQVRSITADAMVLLQRSSDPLVIPKEFEVRKPLRQVGEAKR